MVSDNEMTFLYHVTSEKGYKKLVQVTDKSDLCDAILTKFGLSGSITVQVPFSEDWLEDDWIDAEIDDLPDGGKLRFILEPNSFEALSSSETPSYPALSPAPSTDESDGSGLQGFFRYTLPRLPQDIAEKLSRGDVSIVKQRGQRSRVLQILYDDLLERIGIYPKSHHFATVCQTLVTVYPCLQDKIGTSSNSRGYDTWDNSLKQKFKDARRPDKSNAEIMRMKRTYGFRKNAKRPPPTDILTVAVNAKSKRNPKSVDQEMEDDDELSVQSYVEEMRQEYKDANPDVLLINDRMNRTYCTRRATVANGVVQIEELLELYPALQESSQILLEFQRITQVDISERMSEYWTADRVEVVLGSLVKTKDSATKQLCEEALRSGMIDLQQAVTMLCLPLLFKETQACWVLVLPADSVVDGSLVSAYPTVVVRLQEGARNVIHKNPVEIGVFYENIKICVCSNLLDAFYTVFSMYYVFNVEYPKQLHNTTNFLDAHAIAADKRVKVFPPVQRAINTFDL